MQNDVYLSLGSNIGDRRAYLQRAVSALTEHPHIDCRATSPVYETEPVGYTQQPAFLNMALKMKTALAPESLLQAIQTIEKACGRTREIKWGPRTLDIDILLYGNETIRTPELAIPHPHLLERAFVLVPLADLTGKTFLFPDGTSMQEALSNVSGKAGVRLYAERL